MTGTNPRLARTTMEKILFLRDNVRVLPVFDMLYFRKTANLSKQAIFICIIVCLLWGYILRKQFVAQTRFDFQK